MNRSTDPRSDPAVLARLADRDDHVPQIAFEQLRRGHPASPVDVAATTAMTLEALEPVLNRLVGVGLLERDGDGLIVGARDLTLHPTVRKPVLDGVALHTWCALDAIGIPAALEVDATISTRCGWCHQPIGVHLAEGRASGHDNAAQWLPDTSCDNVRQQFCPDANLFCNRDHLQRWQTDTHSRDGRALTLAESAELGRAWWPTDASCCQPATGHESP